VHDGAELTLPAHLLRLPLVRQETAFSCGDVAALSILRYYEHERFTDVPESALYAPMHTAADFGTDPQPIADYLSEQPGIHAEYHRSEGQDRAELEDLERAVDRGEPTIVAIQAWQAVPTRDRMRPWASDWDDGHYVVVVGYDDGNLYFMDPSTTGRYTYIPRDEFRSRWHDVVGRANVHTDHIAIFIHATAQAWLSPQGPPAAASRIN